MKKTLAIVRDFRAGDDATPIVLMGYYNPIYVYGVDKFLADAKAAGVDGLIVVDLPPEEDAELCLPALKAGAQFHPPRHADHRRQAAADRAHQYVGLRLLRLDHRHYRLRRAGPGCGFLQRLRASSGIQNFRSASASACARPSRPAPSREDADGVVVGSALVDAVRKSLGPGDKPTAATVPAVTDLVRELAEGVRSSRV